MSSRQLLKFVAVNLVDKTITFQITDTPKMQDGSGNHVWPYPWIGAFGKMYSLFIDGTLEPYNANEDTTWEDAP